MSANVDNTDCPLNLNGSHGDSDVVSARKNDSTNEMDYSQAKSDDQRILLNTARTQSNIPKGEYSPAHQPSEKKDNWVYPSEQQYYNAMKRKGWKVDENDVPTVLGIHNSVNEKCWQQIVDWEQRYLPLSKPRLIRFLGRPGDMTPRAWYMHYFLGASRPFDRHDWFVEREEDNKKQLVRYVIDFYDGKGNNNKSNAVSIYLDVRPAIDSIWAAKFRFKTWFDVFSVKAKKQIGWDDKDSK